MALAQTMSENDFAVLVARLSDDVGSLCRLLEETHPIYNERGTAATVRMRGWVLIALARLGLPEQGLPFVLEELDTGHDAYLVAAAARALRSRQPDASFAPYVVRAITNVRPHDDLVSFESYGAYLAETQGSTAVSELLTTLRWIGSARRDVAEELALMIDERRRGELSDALHADVVETLAVIRSAAPPVQAVDDCCAIPWRFGTRSISDDVRHSANTVDSMSFEDHDGRHATFGGLFHGRPTFVVFFYTRCNNPRKCSLSIAKLARVQERIAMRGAAGAVRTAAITYDPCWDSPQRLRAYARSRGVQLDDDNRMLRCDQDALGTLRAHFGLGVNYIESLVNRHRVEAFVLDASGRVAVAFERLQWDERQVTDTLIEMSTPTGAANTPPERVRTSRGPRPGALLTAVAPVAALVVAFIPKCPMCWAAYLSLFGIAGLERLGTASWLSPVMVATIAVNLASLWWRGRATGRMLAFYVGLVGAFAILLLGLRLEVPWSRQVGVLLIVCASALSASRAGLRQR
jgi:protein SCO1/2